MEAVLLCRIKWYESREWWCNPKNSETRGLSTVKTSNSVFILFDVSNIFTHIIVKVQNPNEKQDEFVYNKVTY